jgi:ABC-2 type transport system ATP-binding protein
MTTPPREGFHLGQGYGGEAGGQAALVIADRLTRTFDDRVAVREVSLTVNAGEVVTLLGPNGAGKTTTMRMLAALILPTSGRVSINRIQLSPATAGRARGMVGLLTEAPGLWERLSVRNNLLTHARLQGIADAGARVQEVLQQVDLVDRAADYAGRLSKGLKQRVAIARALLHKPPVLLLDEPTSGLDPASARHVRDLIRELRSQGRAVLVSTHNLAEAEQLSDRIAVLKTRLLAFDTPAALRSTGGSSRVVIDVEDPVEILAFPIANANQIPDIVARVVAEGRRITRVTPEQRSLEDVYLELVGEAR